MGNGCKERVGYAKTIVSSNGGVKRSERGKLVAKVAPNDGGELWAQEYAKMAALYTLQGYLLSPPNLLLHMPSIQALESTAPQRQMTLQGVKNTGHGGNSSLPCDKNWS
jgi:hypothetical protein